MALHPSRWNGLCWVCNQGFPSDDELYIHVLVHPGRHPEDYRNAAEAQHRINTKTEQTSAEEDLSDY